MTLGLLGLISQVFFWLTFKYPKLEIVFWSFFGLWAVNLCVWNRCHEVIFIDYLIKSLIVIGWILLAMELFSDNAYNKAVYDLKLKIKQSKEDTENN